jgi:putative ABC transport system ATP-binding protein
VGLGARLDHHPNQLSGGQQQRVAIARALVNKPAILLADEPTGNLDSQTAGAVVDLFGRLAAEGKTVLLVSHDPDLAHHVTRTILVSDGTVADAAAATPGAGR